MLNGTLGCFSVAAAPAIIVGSYSTPSTAQMSDLPDPLALAMQYGHGDCVKVLEQHARFSGDLAEAVLAGNEKRVKELVHPQEIEPADVNEANEARDPIRLLYYY